MTDTERLDLIEHYRWNVICAEGRVAIYNVDANFKVQADTIREVIDLALAQQIKWSASHVRH